MAGAQQKTKSAGFGLPAAKLDENPYGEAEKAAPVPAPSEKQTQEAASTALRNEIHERHTGRGRVLPKALVERLEGKAVELYNESRNSARERIAAIEKEKGFELTPGQRTKIWKEEYSFAVLREMDGYYRPEAEKRVDARIKNLREEDREAVREPLVNWMARNLALNPRESLQAGAMEEMLWAMDKLSRKIEEIYGKDPKWIPEKAMEELNSRAMEIYKESKENAQREFARIEKNGGALSAGQKVRIWELEYEKVVQEEVKTLGGAKG